MAVIMIRMPRGFEEEKRYITDILSNLSGIEFEAVFSEAASYEIELPNGKKIFIKDAFFSRFGSGENYIDRRNIPDKAGYLSCGFCDSLPVIYGSPSLTLEEDTARLEADLFGSIFFMISRWEEAAISEKDIHGRFCEGSSFAVKNGFIKRPAVDEYIDLLKKIIAKLDPATVFDQHEPVISITCDVDSYEKFIPGKTLRMFAGHLVKRHDLLLFVKDLFLYFAKKTGSADPYDKFDRIMGIAEKFGTKPVFFILTSPEGPYNDGWFNRTEKDTAVFRELFSKGAGTGLHYGYFSLLNENNIRSEKYELEKKYGTPAEKGRAHFLQFDVRSSYGILERSGMKEDQTLGYSKTSGFRCGTGRTFRPWDFNNRKPYEITERPLVLMDTTLYAHNKMSSEQIIAEMEYFTAVSKKFRTDVSVLIHNSSPAYVLDAFEKVNINQSGK